ncbi:hypothetical protein Smic_42540 [Streptomyces microflavus]|uniref:Uncharacterized protein n=1 Tax=Streptomyces microflavus TaxID=1919 RepID=A0A7J0CTH2_STRMI|nr:hypothetical protein Smic_42540 [Streptomyces microflavus]
MGVAGVLGRVRPLGPLEALEPLEPLEPSDPLGPLEPSGPLGPLEPLDLPASTRLEESLPPDAVDAPGVPEPPPVGPPEVVEVPEVVEGSAPPEAPPPDVPEAPPASPPEPSAPAPSLAPGPATTSLPGAEHELPVREQMAARISMVSCRPIPVAIIAPTRATTTSTSPRYSSALCPPSRRSFTIRARLNGRCPPRSSGPSRNHRRLSGRANNTATATGTTSRATPCAPVPPLSSASAPRMNHTCTTKRPRQTPMPPVRTYRESTKALTPGKDA